MSSAAVESTPNTGSDRHSAARDPVPARDIGNQQPTNSEINVHFTDILLPSLLPGDDHGFGKSCNNPNWNEHVSVIATEGRVYLKEVVRYVSLKVQQLYELEGANEDFAQRVPSDLKNIIIPSTQANFGSMNLAEHPYFTGFAASNVSRDHRGKVFASERLERYKSLLIAEAKKVNLDLKFEIEGPSKITIQVSAYDQSRENRVAMPTSLRLAIDFLLRPSPTLDPSATLQSRQGRLGNCYLLAAVDALWNHASERSKLLSNIQFNRDPLSNNVSTVTFPGATGHCEQKISAAAYGNFLRARGNGAPFVEYPEVLLLEVSYGRLRRSRFISGERRSSVSNQDAVQGGYGGQALQDLTGYQRRLLDSSGNSIPSQINYGNLASFAKSRHPKAHAKVDTLLRQIGKKDGDKFALVASTPSRAYALFEAGNKVNDEFGATKGYMDHEKNFLCNHAYSIRRVDAEAKKMVLVNPHNSTIEIEITFDKFKECFALIEGVKLP